MCADIEMHERFQGLKEAFKKNYYRVLSKFSIIGYFLAVWALFGVLGDFLRLSKFSIIGYFLAVWALFWCFRVLFEAFQKFYKLFHRLQRILRLFRDYS